MAQPQQRKQALSVEHQLQLQDLHNEISVIKDNHLVHIAQDIDELDTAIKETKEEFNKRFDKIDERIWWLVGLVVTTLVTIVISMVFGA